MRTRANFTIQQTEREGRSLQPQILGYNLILLLCTMQLALSGWHYRHRETEGKHGHWARLCTGTMR